MYIAKETVILTDVFGKDNQYLKGQSYNLNYSDWGIKKNINGKSVTCFYSKPLHSEKEINYYFENAEDQIIRGGRSNKIKFP